MPIKKRRPQKAISKNEQRLIRRDQQERESWSVGRLGSRFPNVSSLELRLEFVTPQGDVLSTEQRLFRPSDLLDFSAACQGRCGNGVMNMEAAVSQMMNAGQTTRDIKGMCRETLFAGSPETCNCELRCRINATYNPAPAAETP